MEQKPALLVIGVGHPGKTSLGMAIASTLARESILVVSLEQTHGLNKVDLDALEELKQKQIDTFQTIELKSFAYERPFPVIKTKPSKQEQRYISQRHSKTLKRK